MLIQYLGFSSFSTVSFVSCSRLYQSSCDPSLFLFLSALLLVFFFFVFSWSLPLLPPPSLPPLLLSSLFPISLLRLLLYVMFPIFLLSSSPLENSCTKLLGIGRPLALKDFNAFIFKGLNPEFKDIVIHLTTPS